MLSNNQDDTEDKDNHAVESGEKGTDATQCETNNDYEKNGLRKERIKESDKITKDLTKVVLGLKTSKMQQSIYESTIRQGNLFASLHLNLRKFGMLVIVVLLIVQLGPSPKPKLWTNPEH